MKWSFWKFSPWQEAETDMVVNTNYKWQENLGITVLQNRFLEYCEGCNQAFISKGLFSELLESSWLPASTFNCSFPKFRADDRCWTTLSHVGGCFFFLNNTHMNFQGLQRSLGDNVWDYCVRTLILEVTFLNSAAEGEQGLTKAA